MARGRMLNKKIGCNPDVNDLCSECGSDGGLFYTWMLAHLDREGRINGNPFVLKGYVAPLRNEITPELIDRVLHFAHDRHLLLLYEVHGQPFVWFPTFIRNNRGMRPEKEAESEIPPPPDQLAEQWQAFTDAERGPEKVRTNSVQSTDQLRTKCARRERKEKVKSKRKEEKRREDVRAPGGTLLPPPSAEAENARAMLAKFYPDLPAEFADRLVEDFPGLVVADEIRSAGRWEEDQDQPWKSPKRGLTNWMRRAAGEFKREPDTRQPTRSGPGKSDNNEDPKAAFDRLTAKERDRGD